MGEHFRIVGFLGNGPMEPSDRPYEHISDQQLGAFEDDEYTRMRINQEIGNIDEVDESKGEIHEIREERSRRS